MNCGSLSALNKFLQYVLKWQVCISDVTTSKVKACSWSKELMQYTKTISAKGVAMGNEEDEHNECSFHYNILEG